MIVDTLEKAYMWGFGLLQVFVTLFPLLVFSQTSEGTVSTNGGDDCTMSSQPCASPETLTSDASNMEFLPLMLTSVYCAIGLVWAFFRLSVIYLRQTEVTAP